MHTINSHRYNASAPDDSTALIMEWDTRNTSGSDTDSFSVVLPLVANLTIDITVQWEEGVVENFTSTNDLNLFHTYLTEGIKTIKVWRNDGLGDIGFTFNHAPSDRRDYKKILDISQFGNVTMFQPNTSRQRQFHNCSNLQITATDVYENCISGSPYLKGYFRGTDITTLYNSANWDMSHVTNTSEMFIACSTLDIDVTLWDMSSCTAMNGMFQQCGSLNPNVENWNITACTNFTAMFNVLPNFNRDLGGWILNTTSNVSIANLFASCSSFTGQGLDLWDTQRVTNMQYTFSNTDNLDVTKILNWNTSKVVTFFRCFQSNDSLGSADFSSWNVSSCTNFQQMFRLSDFSGSVSGWTLKPSASINCRQMFQDCDNFNGDMNGWTNTASITNISYMLSGCHNYNQSLSNWDTSNITTFAYFLNTCNIFNQDLSSWNFTSATSMLFFGNSWNMSQANIDALLITLSAQVLAPSLVTTFTGNYTLGGLAEAAYIDLTTVDLWTINGLTGV